MKILGYFPIISFFTKSTPNFSCMSSTFQQGLSVLDEILQYKNENVIYRFQKLYDVSEEEAEELFVETKKFLYLARFGDVFIPEDMTMIDEMWHNFILFTKDYDFFCKKFLGKFLHHVPTEKQEELGNALLSEKEASKAREAYLNRIEELISLTYDHLGEETAIRWFSEYPERYSAERIKTLRK